jgi:hypothetical protein
MSRPVKTFRVMEDEQPPEPLTFEIEFVPKDPDQEPRVESFQALGKAPAGATLALASIARTDRYGRQRPDMNGMMTYFEIVMPEGEYTRFRSLLEDPKLMVHIDTVGDIFVWLTEEYAERPTERSRRSSRTRPDDGRIVPVVAREPSGEVELASSTSP